MAAKPKPIKSSNYNKINKTLNEAAKTNPKSKKPMKGSNRQGGEKPRRKSGPRLPNAMRRQVDAAASGGRGGDDDEVFDSEDEFMGLRGGDVYDYEEVMAEEESKKNRRYDPVDNYTFELPDDFKDEEVPSDEEDINDESHGRMLQAVTGMPSVAFERKNATKPSIITEPYPESEYNPTHDVLDGTRKISAEDLIAPLAQSSEYSKLRKRMQYIKRNEIFAQAPLPKVEKDKLERKAANEFLTKDISNWEGLVKRNREASTVFFDENTDVGFSTVGAIASEFKPRTDFEKAMDSLLRDSEVVEAHNKDGAKLLELNKVSVEEVKDRLNRNAKMRHLLFRHELKAKHIKKIKSKTYHRLMKKDKLKAAALDMEADPESAKELARKQEFKRAEERMTLKHKNKSKWAKRILQRGLDAQDEGTRAAITEQLHQHELLTRKMNSLKDESSSSDESSDEYDDDLNGSDDDGASRMLEKAKKKTIALVDDEDEKPQLGVMSLPFMVRGMEKKREAAIEQAKAAIDEYESLMNPQKDKGRRKGQAEHVSSGRLVFGGDRTQVPTPTVEPPRSDHGNLHGDSDDEIETGKHASTVNEKSNSFSKDVALDLDALREDGERAHDSVLKSVDDVIKDPNPKTTYDVAIFADGSWRKMKAGDENAPRSGNNADFVEANMTEQDVEEAVDDSDAESEGQMIDGILTSETKQTYELPSQEELIRRAFAADDVEEDFEKAKQEVLDEENPAPEEPKLIPGWGQWTDVQQKRGVPSWMIKEHDHAKKKRDEALKKRKDANLKNVIISEKVDKKAERLFSQTLPYPFTSKDVFDQTMRMPIGPEFNPASAFRALTRPDVVTTPGIIVKPIKFLEVDPHEKADDEKSGGKRQRKKGKEVKGSGNSKASNDAKRRRQ